MDITTIIKWAVLIIIAAGLLLYYHFKVPKESDKSTAQQFIDGYTTVFENIVKKVITDIDITKYKTIEEFETDIFKITYDQCWEYIEERVKEATENCSISALVRKCITREFVEDFITTTMHTFINRRSNDIYIKRVSQVIAQAEEEDARRIKEADEYESGTKEVEPYIEPEVDNTKDIILNPQRDEEEGFNPEDESQEIVE